jgi:hypothetical protein
MINVREYDHQAVLFGTLRQRLPNPVPVRFVMHPPRARRHEWSNHVTARVHGEACIGRKGVAGNAVNVDLVVFRDSEVALRCHAHGPTALQETMSLDDVEVPIEIKNAPSMNAVEATRFARDVRKLAVLQRGNPRLVCLVVVLDQSVSLSGARSSTARPRNWLSLVKGMTRHVQEPTVPAIEVWFVDPSDRKSRFIFTPTST